MHSRKLQIWNGHAWTVRADKSYASSALQCDQRGERREVVAGRTQYSHMIQVRTVGRSEVESLQPAMTGTWLELEQDELPIVLARDLETGRSDKFRRSRWEIRTGFPCQRACFLDSRKLHMDFGVHIGRGFALYDRGPRRRLHRSTTLSTNRSRRSHCDLGMNHGSTDNSDEYVVRLKLCARNFRARRDVRLHAALSALALL